MTQIEHNLIAFIFLMITWHVLFKKYFIRSEEKVFWSEWLDKRFFNQK
jgi:hypothetical protein